MAHVLLMTISGDDVDSDSVEALLNKAKDWLRYADGCWLIQTNQSAQTWFARLRPLFASKKTLVLVSKVDLNERSGQLSPEAWTWIKRVREHREAMAS